MYYIVQFGCITLALVNEGRGLTFVVDILFLCSLCIMKMSIHLLLLNDLHQGLETSILFIVLRKAFDTLNFEILLKKLKYYRIYDMDLK